MSAGERSSPARRTTRRRFGELENEFLTYMEFSPAPGEWDALEKAIKADFSSDLKGRIREIVERFMERSAAVQASPFADDVEQEWDSLRRAAEELSQRLRKEQPTNEAQTALSNLRLCLESGNDADQDPLDEINRRLGSIAEHCANLIQQSRARAKQPNEFDY